jgi:ABC-type uncharacterized transport system substrate-binding protein
VSKLSRSQTLFVSRRVLALACLCLAWVVTTAAADPLHILVITDFDNPRYREVVNSLYADLDRLCQPSCSENLRIDEIDTNGFEHETEASLLVAIGTPAARRLAQTPGEIPRLYGFVPRLVWQQLLDCCDVRPHRDSAVWIDPSPARQLHLARQVEPQAARVGVLLGPSTAITTEDLRNAGKLTGLETIIALVETSAETGSKLRSLVDVVDVLLALPDPTIYNRHSIYSILLSTYSARVPVVGFSAAMVGAGAAATTFVSPQDAGESIAAAIQRFEQYGNLPPAGYGEHFSLAVNDKVMRSLGLPVVDQEVISKHLQEGPR